MWLYGRTNIEYSYWPVPQGIQMYFLWNKAFQFINMPIKITKEILFNRFYKNIKYCSNKTDIKNINYRLLQQKHV